VEAVLKSRAGSPYKLQIKLNLHLSQEGCIGLILYSLLNTKFCLFLSFLTNFTSHVYIHLPNF
jgi:hypothetical protein